MPHKRKIAFVGAGSIVFTRALLSDIYTYPELKNIIISLMDIDKERLEIAKLVAAELKNERGSYVRIETHMELEPALKEADYVINTVQIGGKESTYIDFDIPEKYGLKQTIGDTHGIGGVMRFLRTAPFLKNLCQTMEKVCSNALLLNFTNPMSMCMWYINSVSKIRSVGLCHSVPNTIGEISKYVDVPFDKVNYRVAGINHMAWVLNFRGNGEDLYPKLREAMNRKGVWKKDPVRFEIMKNFSYFVTESSEHMAEYVPYFIKDEKLIEKLNIPIREYVRRVELNEKIYETEKAYYLEGKRDMKDIGEKMTIEYYSGQGKDVSNLMADSTKSVRSNEYAVQIIHALEAGESTIIYGIVPNNGMITNLPDKCMVEIPISVDKNGLQPVGIGELPPQLASLNLMHINVQNMAVKAVLTKNRNYIHYAALMDPLAASVLSMGQIHSMVEELITAHKRYLSEFL